MPTLILNCYDNFKILLIIVTYSCDYHLQL